MGKYFKKLGKLIVKRWWYIVLLTSSSLFVMHHRHDIHDFSELDSCNLIFIVWILLLLFPLFSELEFLGIKVKKEIGKATDELKESIRNLQLQIVQMQVSNSVATNIQIDTNKPLATKSELNMLRESIQTPQTSHVKYNNEVLDETPDMKNRMFLFKVRFLIETKMQELCAKLGYSGPPMVSQMSHFLRKAEVLQGSMFEIVTQINRIANRGIHGEIVSAEYLEFVQQAYPGVVKNLTRFQKTWSLLFVLDVNIQAIL